MGSWRGARNASSGDTLRDRQRKKLVSFQGEYRRGKQFRYLKSAWQSSVWNFMRKRRGGSSSGSLQNETGSGAGRESRKPSHSSASRITAGSGGAMAHLAQNAQQMGEAKLRAIKAELVRRMHDPPAQVGEWLRKVVQGYYQYHAVPGNLSQLSAFRHRLCRLCEPF